MSQDSDLSGSVSGRRRRTLLLIAAGGLLFIAAIVGVVLWLSHGRQLYTQARAAYQQADYQAALPLYARLASYPSFLARFAGPAAAERSECLAYEQAAQVVQAGESAPAIEACEAFLARYPSGPLAPLAVSTVHEQYLAWGERLRASGDYAQAEAAYTHLATDYPQSAQQAQEQVLATYLSWGESQRGAADFAGSISTYDRLSSVYSQFASQAEEQLATTYLAWGQVLRTEREFAKAVAAYDDMARRAGTFAAMALDPTSATYLEWGAYLRTEGSFSEAEDAYRTLIDREHARLENVPVYQVPWPEIWPHPYAATGSDSRSFATALRAGPGLGYAAPAGRVLDGRPLAVVGADSSGAWYALDLAQPVDVPAGVTSLRDLAWQPGSAPVIAWVPADQATLALTNGLDIPFAGVLAVSVAAKSGGAAQALADLQGTYEVWAASALSAGRFDEAARVSLALAELQLDGAKREAGWQRVAQTYLTAAQTQAMAGYYTSTIAYSLQAEEYDRLGQVSRPARVLRAGSLLALGDQQAHKAQWIAAMIYYDGVLALERRAFGPGQVTVKGKTTPLFAAPDSSSQSVQAAEAGRQFAALARQGDWVLVLAPAAPSARAWVPAGQVDLSVPLADLAPYDEAAQPVLYSHAALISATVTGQAAAQALYVQGDYRQTISQCQPILDDPDKRALATGLADLGALAWVGLGDTQLQNEQPLDAIRSYARAQSVAPKSAAAATAGIALAKSLADVKAALAGGGGCEQVTVLDVLAQTTVKKDAAGLLPQAIYQCAEHWLASDARDPARQAFQRVLDDYPKSSYAAKAKRGLQILDWRALVAKSGLAGAAEEVCKQAGSAVKGRVSSLTKPYVVYPVGWSGSSLPAEWTGDNVKTTALVCAGDLNSSVLQRCPYTGSHSLVRRRYYQAVRIVDPIARVTVAKVTLYGGTPNACPFTRGFGSSTENSYGSRVDSDDIVAWLKKQLK